MYIFPNETNNTGLISSLIEKRKEKQLIPIFVSTLHISII